MVDLRNWSFVYVLLASALWVALIVGLAAAYIYIQFWHQANATGSGGLGAVSVGASELFVLVIVFGPPIALALTWFVVRRF